MILVLGASNPLGQEICRLLRSQGRRVKALLLPTAAGAVESLRQAQVEIVFGDMHNAGSVAAACQGAGALICADSAMLPANPAELLDRERMRILVELGRAIGVRRFVYVTPVNAEFRTRCVLLDTREEFCDRLYQRSVNYTIIHANLFMETWLHPALGFDYSNASAVIFGDGSRPVAWVSCRDVAECALQALSLDDSSIHNLTVAGPDNLSPLEVVRTFEDVCGRQFAVQHVSEAALRDEYKAAADPISKALAALKLDYAAGRPLDPRSTQPKTPSRLSVRDYAMLATHNKVASA
jgi:uncharacterized protein YbjT (DUF2867 family)